MSSFIMVSSQGFWLKVPFKVPYSTLFLFLIDTHWRKHFNRVPACSLLLRSCPCHALTLLLFSSIVRIHVVIPIAYIFFCSPVGSVLVTWFMDLWLMMPCGCRRMCPIHLNSSLHLFINKLFVESTPFCTTTAR